MVRAFGSRRFLEEDKRNACTTINPVNSDQMLASNIIDLKRAAAARVHVTKKFCLNFIGKNQDSVGGMPGLVS
jgi:hypothetical protein